MYKHLTTSVIDIKRTFEKLSENGVTSLKILDENSLMGLLEEARNYTYRPLPEIVGRGENVVKQQMERFNDFSEDSKFILLKNSFQVWLDEHLKRLEEYPFEIALDHNSLELLKYESGSIGITPHRDNFRYKNLICIFIIGGRGKFYTCSDRSGIDAQEIDTSPGNVILMKAPGFLYQKERPFHFVTDIQETRYVFGLRQEVLGD